MQESKMSYVLLGHFNPAIYSEDFFRSYLNLGMESTAGAATEGMVSQLKSAEDPTFTFLSLPDRMEFKFDDLLGRDYRELIEYLSATVQNLLVTLPHTPVNVAGFNIIGDFAHQTIEQMCEQTVGYLTDCGIEDYEKIRQVKVTGTVKTLMTSHFTFSVIGDQIRRKFGLQSVENGCRLHANFEFRRAGSLDSILHFVIRSPQLVENEFTRLLNRFEEAPQNA